jgi:hypothetical protein
MPRFRVNRFAVLLGAVMVVTGCQLDGSSAPVQSGGPSVSGTPVPEATCRPIDLRTPAGEALDLTGTWQGGVMVHHVRQNGDCVWWIAYGTWPGTTLGETGTVVFAGRLASDFTLRGRFEHIVQLANPDVYGLPGSGRELAFSVVFDDAGNATTLERLGPVPVAPPMVYFDELLHVGPLPEPADPPQQ